MSRKYRLIAKSDKSETIVSDPLAYRVVQRTFESGNFHVTVDNEILAPHQRLLIDFGPYARDESWTIRLVSVDNETWMAECFMLGYTGTTIMGAGYFYCPVTPITSTPAILDPNAFQPNKGIMAKYGKKFVKQKP